jgi:hypothetical protein
MRIRSSVLAGAILTVLGCGYEVTSPSRPTAATGSDTELVAAAADSVLLVVAGDMHANCTSGNRSPATAALVQRYPDALVIPLGDNAGVHGTAPEYQCYHQSWGTFKSRTYATIGNHELNQDTTATAYYDYFNGVGVDSGRAGHRDRGYYALGYGGWRILVANSHQNTRDQTAWMTQQLAVSPRLCTMAIWHRPFFTSKDRTPPVPRLRPWWQVLYSARADLILNGHNHYYERFAKLTPDGAVDTARGIREFVVGTGGTVLETPRPDSIPGSRRRIRTWGVLKLTLWPNRYKWQFIDVNGSVLDRGSDRCR